VQVVSETDKLKALCKGVRSISPGFEVKLTASSDNPEHWCVTVGSRDAIIVYTDFGLLDTVIGLAISKLANVSQRTLAALKDDK
jgi:hypothetical protein